MFERYSEKARRSIFFARYEASRLGSPYIETEHFLLGVMREDKTLVPYDARVQICSDIEAQAEKREKISTSVDLPLSEETRRALEIAAVEAETLGHKTIECAHQLLGLLQLEGSRAAALLAEHGIGPGPIHAALEKLPHAPEKPDHPEEPSGPVHPLSLFVFSAKKHLEWLRESDAEERLKVGPWTRKEALGHLIDSATAHHQWISRALVEPRVTGAGYPGEDRVAAQRYAQVRWSVLLRLWIAINHLLGHVILQIPEEKKQTPCRIGIEDEIPLQMLIDRYISHVQDVVAQILTKG